MPGRGKPLIDQLVRTLTSLGYPVTVRDRLPATPQPSSAPAAQVAFTSRNSPVPDILFDDFVACSGQFNGGWFCDPALDRLLRRAHALSATDPAGAARLWADLNQRVVDEAVFVPLANGRSVELLSPRVGGYQNHTYFGFLPAQAWVR